HFPSSSADILAWDFPCNASCCPCSGHKTHHIWTAVSYPRTQNGYSHLRNCRSKSQRKMIFPCFRSCYLLYIPCSIHSSDKAFHRTYRTRPCRHPSCEDMGYILRNALCPVYEQIVHLQHVHDIPYVRILSRSHPSLRLLCSLCLHKSHFL